MNKIIFLDMDGVLCDFSGGACRLFGWDATARHKYGWDFWEGFGYTEADFHAGIIKAGEPFWAGLDELPHARQIYDHCLATGAAVMFASSPTREFSGVRGKYEWLVKLTGKPNVGRQFIPILLKELLAGPNRLLIDDKDENVEAFRSAGGSAILFPQPWNARRMLVNEALKLTCMEIDEWMSAK